MDDRKPGSDSQPPRQQTPQRNHGSVASIGKIPQGSPLWPFPQPLKLSQPLIPLQFPSPEENPMVRIPGSWQGREPREDSKPREDLNPGKI